MPPTHRLSLLLGILVVASCSSKPDLTNVERHRGRVVSYEYPGNWKASRETEAIDGVSLTTHTIESSDGIAMLMVYTPAIEVDLDEIVVATDTLSFDDYLEARKYALTFSIFWNNSWFEDAARFAGQFGVTPSQWMRATHAALQDVTGPIAELLDDFLHETRNELFPTREACVDFYSRDENWEQLLSGEASKADRELVAEMLAGPSGSTYLVYYWSYWYYYVATVTVVYYVWY